MSPSPEVVRIESVSKRFVLHHDRSLKERALAVARRQSSTTQFMALDDVSLDVSLGTTLGLVGHNGSGKSTLLKVIGGIIEPTMGRVYRRGRLAALLELGAGFHPDLTGRENVYLNAAILGLTRAETGRHFAAIVDFSGIEDFIDTQVKFYSSGMYVRLAFAIAVHVDPDLLLVDEVLAVGDEPFQRKCMAKISDFQAEGRTIILVSHSSQNVADLCDTVAVLDGGVLEYWGAPDGGLRALRDQYERRQRRIGASETSAAGEDSAPLVLRRALADVVTSGGERQLVVEIAVEVREAGVDWGVYFSLDSTLGVRLFGMETYPMDVTLPNTVGEHDITLRFPRVELGAGTYLVNVGVGVRGHRMCHSIPGASTIEIGHQDVGHGLIRLQPELTIKD